VAPPVRQWPVCRNRWAGLVRAVTGRAKQGGGTLSLHASGLWQLALPAGAVDMRLVHAWPSSAWMALRFQSGDPAPQGPLELTIWKSGLSDHAWRELRLCVEQQIAIPQRIQPKEHA